MRELTLEEIKKIEIDILENVLDFCREKNLRCWMFAGTALGAVRHGGFIPWDDDIDIGMPREDYEIFAKTYNGFSKQYFFADYRMQGWYLQFGKVFDNKTKTQEMIYNPLPENGVYIDIFPIDGLSDDYSTAVKHASKIKKLWAVGERIFVNKKLPNINLKNFTKNIYRVVFSKVITLKMFTWYFEHRLQKYQFDNSKYVGSITAGMYGRKEVIKKEWMEPTVYFPFDRLSVPLYKDYHKYLSGLYGDYMQLPPEDERKTHHSFKAYYK